MSSNPEQFSLSEEIKRRKAQAAQREIEQRRLARICGEKLPAAAPGQKFIPTAAQPASRVPDSIIKPIPPRPPIQPLPPRPAILETPRPVSHAASLSPRQLRVLFGALAAVAVFLLAGIGAVVITTSAPATATPDLSLAPLPMVSATEVLTYLQHAGIPAMNVREFAAPNDSFAANAELQFEVYRGQDKGLFIVLSYPSSEKRIPDLFKVNASPRFSAWGRTSVSNVMLLASPDTTPALQKELSDHLMQYLVAPYRPHYATATPMPTAAP